MPAAKRAPSVGRFCPKNAQTLLGPPTPRRGSTEETLTCGDPGSHQTDDPATWGERVYAAMQSPPTVLLVGRGVLHAQSTANQEKGQQRE